MVRLMAKAVDGPLHGMFFSVAEDQQTIEGFNDMPEGSVYSRDNSTLRDFVGDEKSLAKLLFDTEANNFSFICDFRYNENPA